MPTYVFKGRNRMNESVMGERVADNREALRQTLRREQVTLTSVKEKGREIGIPKLTGRRKVNSKDLAIFTRQFSVMIDAGLPLVQCLDILSQQQQNKHFQGVLAQVRQDVEEGSTLAAAMSRHPKVFDQLYSNMVEAGETGGILDLILQRLSTFIEKIVKLKRDVISALIYPAAVIFMAIGAIAVIMVVVIPQFQNIFLGLLGPGEPLPLPTRIVVGISSFLAGWGGLVILIAIIGMVVGLHFYYKTPGGRKRIDFLLLKLPVLGPIFLKIAMRSDPAITGYHGTYGRQRHCRRGDYQHSHGRRTGKEFCRALARRRHLPAHGCADGRHRRADRRTGRNAGKDCRLLRTGSRRGHRQPFDSDGTGSNWIPGNYYRIDRGIDVPAHVLVDWQAVPGTLMLRGCSLSDTGRRSAESFPLLIRTSYQYCR